MSAKVDAERRGDSVEARTERAKNVLRLAQLVLTAFVDGKGCSETARGIMMPSGRAMSRTTAWKLRVWLGLESGRQWKSTGKRTGPLSSKRALQAVQP
jgi:hypothetical protein